MPDAAEPEHTARREFLAIYKADLDAGRIRALAEYQALFPGHEESLADEWRWLEPETHDGGVSPSTDSGQQLIGDDKSGAYRIGDYRITAELGRGAQATVYLAEHESLHRQVALKVLRAPVTDGTSRSEQRFRREAEVTASIEHPNICSVYEAGTSDGATWIAMQYVPGSTLATHLARRDDAVSQTTLRLPVGDPVSGSGSGSAAPSSGGDARSDLVRVVAFAEQTARALHVAHEHGLVHRDIKPGNLMVAEGGRPVILDFGLARTADREGPGLTMTNDVLGTPYYMAPEQLGHDVDTVDRRTDVYALGVTLYECLTRRHPFEAISVEALFQQILSSEPPSPRSINPNIPRDLEVVVLTAIEKDRNRRYQTALDLAEDLRRVRQYEPIRAKRISGLGRVVRMARRHPGVAASLSIAVVSLVVGLVISLLSLREARQSLGEADEAIAGWYDNVSRRAARDNARGLIREELVELRDLAVEQINRESEGFGRRLLEVLNRAASRAPGDDESLKGLFTVLDQAEDLSLVGRHAVADLLHPDVQHMTNMLALEPQYGGGLGVELARREVALLGDLPSTDARRVRARIFLLDALNQADGRENAKALAERWLREDLDMHIHQDHARRALYESRRGAALLRSGDDADAYESLLASVPLVSAGFPHSWYSNMAKAHLVEVLEKTGKPSEKARKDLGESLRQSLGHRLLGHHPIYAARMVFGVGHEPLWNEMMDLFRLSLSELGDLDGFLRRLHQSDKPNTESVSETAACFYLLVAPGVANNLRMTHADKSHPDFGRLTRLSAEYVEKLPCHDSHRVHVYSRYAWYLAACGRYPEACVWLDAAVAACPVIQRWTIEDTLGACLSRRGDYERAAVLLKRSLAAAYRWYDRRSEPAENLRSHLANLYRMWGRLDEAIVWRGRPGSRRESPHDHLVLGATYLQFGSFEEAEQAIRGALDLNPGYVQARSMLAQISLRQGDLDQAIERAEAARTLALGELEDLAERKVVGSPAERRREQLFAKRAACGADRIQAMARFARDAKGDLEAALALFESAATAPVRLDGDGFFSDYGAALVKSGQPQKAFALLEDLTARRPGDPLAHHARARFLVETGLTPAQALVCAKTANDLCKSRRAFVLATLAEAQFRAGETSAAQQTAVAVVELMAKNKQKGLGVKSFTDAMETLRESVLVSDAQWLSVKNAETKFERYK